MKDNMMLNTKILGALAALALLAACDRRPRTPRPAPAPPRIPRPARARAARKTWSPMSATASSSTPTQSTIRADQRSILERQAAWLARYPQVTVQLEGHADERGTREYNLALGQRRANAARDLLVASGVSGARIADHLLRQGPPGRARLGRGCLGAEPPRRHRRPLRPCRRARPGAGAMARMPWNPGRHRAIRPAATVASWPSLPMR